MSSALAIAGVTAVLKDVLSSGILDQHLTDVVGDGVIISALAPDAVQLGSDVAPRLNLFLHQVTHNAAWRNVGQPSRDGAGERTSNPPLALDLHYLLTAYASGDLQAEVLLGHATFIAMVDRCALSVFNACYKFLSVVKQYGITERDKQSLD